MRDLVRYKNELYYFYNKPNTPNIIIVNLHKQLKAENVKFNNFVFNDMTNLSPNNEQSHTDIIIKIMNRYLFLDKIPIPNEYMRRFNFINFVWASTPNVYTFNISIEKQSFRYSNRFYWVLRNFRYVDMERAKQEYFRHLL